MKNFLQTMIILLAFLLMKNVVIADNNDAEEYYTLDETSGQAIDSQGNNNSVSVSATQGVAGKFGNCYLFNGTTDKVTLGDSPNWSIKTTDDVSFSCWINLAGTSKTMWSTLWGNAANVSMGIVRSTKADGTFTDDLTYSIYWYGGGAREVRTDPLYLDNDKWYHIVVVKNSDISVSFYLDNEQIGLVTPSDKDVNPPAVYIGGDEANEGFYGKIDELRIWKKALTVEEIATLYNPGPPAAEEYYNLNETSGQVIDSQGNNNSVSVATTQGVTGKIGNCYLFNGSTDKVTLGDSPNWSIKTTDNVSFSCWINLNGASLGGNEWSTIWGNAANVSFGIDRSINPDGTYTTDVTYKIYWYAGGGVVLSDPLPLDNGTWYHIAVVKNSDISVSMYLDNELVGFGKPSDKDVDPPAVYIGGDEANEGFNGKIDELGIWKKALTDDDVAALYNIGVTWVSEYTQMNISHYPQPVSGILNITNLPNQSVISVYSLIGQKVLQQLNGNESNITMRMNSLHTGIYLLRITNGSNVVKSFKVIKQ